MIAHDLLWLLNKLHNHVEKKYVKKQKTYNPWHNYKRIGAAHNRLKVQFERLIKEYPQFDGYCPATINIILSSPLFIKNSDFKYTTDDNEVFKFTEAELILNQSTLPEKGFILEPSNSPHRFNHWHVEFFCHKVEFNHGDYCELLFAYSKAKRQKLYLTILS